MDLKWIGDKSSYDSEEHTHTHTQNLSDTLGINDKVENRKLTFIKWEEAYKSPLQYKNYIVFCNSCGERH